MEAREERGRAMRPRRTFVGVAGVLTLLAGFLGYLGGASGDGPSAPRGEEAIMRISEARAASRPPIDLAAPTAFETATFALG